MAHPSAAKGKKYERDVLAYARNRGTDIERLRDTGVHDEGDFAVRTGQLTFVLEAKAEKRMNLSGYLAEAEREAAVYSANRGGRPTIPAAVVKRPGYGVGRSYVVMELDTFLDLTDRIDMLHTGGTTSASTRSTP